MCRIAGIVDPSLTAEELQSLLAKMCHVQQHGGPDDEGFFLDPENGVGLGHRRLSLIDLSPGGHQPMFYRDGSLVISYNGELYNYPELKEELAYLGFTFTTSSDTEVILASFAAWGVNAFKRFSGMFAFALLNCTTGQLYLVRDVSGIKPLYYSYLHNTLVFASEVKALEKTIPGMQANDTWPVHFLAYGHLPEPVTTLKDVQPLPKGHFLEYNLATRKITLEYFAYFSYIEKLGDRAEVLAAIRQGLEASVKRHLLSDAAIGAFLSGGIDSSLIALLAGRTAGKNLNTLSLYFQEETYSEKKYQDLVLQQMDCNHTGHLLSAKEFTDCLPTILSAMDLPSCDGINTWFISKTAKEAGLKAVLSGLGGDELFGGYPSFERMKFATYLQSLPKSSLRAGKYSNNKKFHRLPFLSLEGIKGKYLFLRGQFIPSEIARHLDMEEKQVWKILDEHPSLPDTRYLSQKNQAGWMEMNLYMQNQLLRDSDVMSMAHGVEIRVPFLDNSFVKLALQIRSEVKYSNRGKQLLIDAFQDLLPEAVYNRPKMGFAFPFREWLQQNEWVKEQLLASNKETNKIYDLFLKGSRHWSQLICLLMVQNAQVGKKDTLSYA